MNKNVEISSLKIVLNKRIEKNKELCLLFYLKYGATTSYTINIY